MWCAAIPGLQTYIFRRIREDLVKNHMEGPKGFRSMLAPWVSAGWVVIVEDEIRFWNGSKIYLCHCKDEKDRFKYQGAEIHVLLIDELTHFSDVIYRFLRGRVRAVGLKVPDDYKGMFPRILCGSNPGNIGHLWVKEAFVERCPPLEIIQVGDEDGGMLRQYIPAKLDDNPAMMEDDPSYRAKLRGLGSEALVKAMEDGDWDIIDGAYFDCWSTEKHVVKPFTIPERWLKFRSFDWGSARPFSVGWWAVVPDTYRTPDKRTLPKGAMVRYREWYGAKSANTGLKLTVEQVAEGIKQREEGDKVTYGVADPAIFAEDGGPSMAHRMITAAKIVWKPADNQRVPGNRGPVGGWNMVRQRLQGEDGRPMIYCFDTCRDSIRTIPALQHDEKKPEDLDTDGEDHAADEWRYACMSRPWIPVENKKPVADRWDKAFNKDEGSSWRTT